ncbi:MAG TPA: PAC2 family protein, partial [Acidimicrobiales bacterium]
ELAARVGLATPTYEGPTGIVGVLLDALRTAGLPAASFWAAVPHYVHQLPSPKAALALVERSAALLGAPFDPLVLRAAAEEYERDVSERVADDEDAAAYVAQLEDAEDFETAGSDTAGPSDELGSQAGPLVPGGVDELADEVERFLRDHRREG